MARHNDVGTLGESIASRFLKNRGFSILERNFKRPYGEIDIVSRESSGKIHFVEVKTVSYETGSSVPYETIRPEENMHPQKMRRLARITDTYLISRGFEGEWQSDLVAVFLDTKNKKAKVRFLENIILGL